MNYCYWTRNYFVEEKSSINGCFVFPIGIENWAERLEQSYFALIRQNPQEKWKLKLYFIKSDDYSSSKLDQNYSLSTVCISLLRPTQVGVLKFHLEIDLESLASSKTLIKFDLAVRMRKTDRIDSEKIRHKNRKINAMKRRVRIIAMVLIRQYYGIFIFCIVSFLPFFVGWRMIFFPRTRSSLCNNVKFNLSMKYPQATPLIMWIVDSLLCYINAARNAEE